MQDDKMPKVFISYSWSSDRLVLELAQRLISHGVDVVLDKWELKEGQDKYAFMERCVNDPDITKVLIICDRVYAQKANNRTGGVGDETVIISGEIYGKMKQEKFIPIIAERDDEGNEYLPAYIKTRIYIDLSDATKYEEQYEKLLRNIYEKPQLVKPKLGKRPEWLDEEKTNFFPLKDLIRQMLVLAIVKTFNVDEATAWVEGKKQDLIKLDTVTENAFNEISENKGIEIAKFIKNISPDNMYILCKSKISEVGELINSNGALYLDFESALPYYEKNGILTGNDPETTEFNDIMNFLYMGRKEKIKEISNESNPYVILNFMF